MQTPPDDAGKIQPDFQAALGAEIRSERIRQRVTQQELATRAGLHRTYLANIERLGKNLTLRSVMNLSQALQVPVKNLLARSGAFGKAERPPKPLGEILLVEDDRNDAELTVAVFQRAHFASPVKVVTTGHAAIEYLLLPGNGEPRPELILLDLELPDISGIKVLRIVKEHPRTRDIPVVVLTGSRHDRNILECSRLGAVNYIIKPIAFENFSKLLPDLNLKWALVNSQTKSG